MFVSYHSEIKNCSVKFIEYVLVKLIQFSQLNTGDQNNLKKNFSHLFSVHLTKTFSMHLYNADITYSKKVLFLDELLFSEI